MMLAVYDAEDADQTHETRVAGRLTEWIVPSKYSDDGAAA